MTRKRECNEEVERMRKEKKEGDCKSRRLEEEIRRQKDYARQVVKEMEEGVRRQGEEAKEKKEFRKKIQELQKLVQEKEAEQTSDRCKISALKAEVDERNRQIKQDKEQEKRQQQLDQKIISIKEEPKMPDAKKLEEFVELHEDKQEEHHWEKEKREQKEVQRNKTQEEYTKGILAINNINSAQWTFSQQHC